jgi:hypothetical protein
MRTEWLYSCASHSTRRCNIPSACVRGPGALQSHSMISELILDWDNCNKKAVSFCCVNLSVGIDYLVISLVKVHHGHSARIL